jgi:hypothetical protein
VRTSRAGYVTLESVFVVPMALLSVLIVLQISLWWWARQSALSAAQAGLAAIQAGQATQGGALARQLASEVGGVRAVTVAVSTSGSLDRVVVSGRALSLVPGMPIAIREHADAPGGGYEAP